MLVMTSMARPRLPAASTDPLGDALHLLELTGALYCRAELTAPWGIALPEMPGHMIAYIVTTGRCWLRGPEAEPRLLQQASLALVPHGVAHSLRSGPRASVTPLADLPVEHVSERYEILRHGGGGDFAHVTGAVVRFDHVAAHRLTSLLPPVLQLDTWDDDEGSWLASTVRFISREARQLRPGGETVITRLADVLVIQAIRAWIDRSTGTEQEQGWLGALRDPQVGRALAAMHRHPAHEWTLQSLAKELGMSRSAFAARFSELVGEPPLQYLTRWRLQLARSQLSRSGQSIAEVARAVGYGSESAFSRAFKRELGLTPAQARRA